MEKWNPTQEAINKALRPNTIRKWLNTFLIILIGAGVILLVIFFGSKKPTVNPPSEKNTTISEGNYNVHAEQKPNESPSHDNIVIEDFSSYINPSLNNTSDKTNIAVTVVDEVGNISSSISSSIANIYNQTGNSGNTGLLRSSFIHKSGFQELFEGNSEIIEKLKLSNHADYVALGKIQYSTSKGTLVDGTFVCTATITMSIISANQKSIAKNFSFSEKGNGVSESQAKEYALRNLIDKYNNEYSSL